jgi:hypothetical protein
MIMIPVRGVVGKEIENNSGTREGSGVMCMDGYWLPPPWLFLLRMRSLIWSLIC